MTAQPLVQTSYSRDDGQAILIVHREALKTLLGDDLLRMLREWTNGSTPCETPQLNAAWFWHEWISRKETDRHGSEALSMPQWTLVCEFAEAYRLAALRSLPFKSSDDLAAHLGCEIEPGEGGNRWTWHRIYIPSHIVEMLRKAYVTSGMGQEPFGINLPCGHKQPSFPCRHCFSRLAGPLNGVILTSATAGERDAKELAKELVYSVRGWGQRSPEFILHN